MSALLLSFFYCSPGAADNEHEEYESADALSLLRVPLLQHLLGDASRGHVSTPWPRLVS
jgi:hypothetical protein